MENEKLYRIRTKEGAHLNEKVNSDGYRAAIQFDDKNGLQGPIEFQEVDPEDLYYDWDDDDDEDEETGRGLGQALIEDVAAPIIGEIVGAVAGAIIDAGVRAASNLANKVIVPAAKKAGRGVVTKVREGREKKKAQKRAKEATVMPAQTPAEVRTVEHTQEEVNQIENGIQFAILYIAAGIRELSRTVIVDEGMDEETARLMQEKLRELTSDQVTSTIEFLLAEENRDKLDQATVLIFDAFRNREFIVGGKRVPISSYLEIE